MSQFLLPTHAATNERLTNFYASHAVSGMKRDNPGLTVSFVDGTTLEIVSGKGIILSQNGETIRHWPMNDGGFSLAIGFARYSMQQGYISRAVESLLCIMREHAASL